MEEVLKFVLRTEELEFLEKLNVQTKRQQERVHVTKNKNFNCSMCGFKCHKKDDLIRHTRTHTGERPFKCEVPGCEIAFKRESHLDDHIKYKHSDKRPLKCEFPNCVYTAKTSTSLSSHKKMHSAERSFTCPIDGCSFQSKWKRAITRHIQCVHNQAKTFACTKCDYRTAESSNLKRHMCRHSATRDSKCNPHCTASFKTSKSLQSNLSHLHGEPMIQCDSPGCGQYGTAKQAHKDRHKSHNRSSWPFQCPLCLKNFRNLRQMQRHCFVHTNEKPFQCGHCKFEAIRRLQVKTHISSAHADIQFPFIVHLVDNRECLRCKVTLPKAEFLIHSQSHEDPVSRCKD